MTTTPEVNPHIKEHNGVKICFADTLTQANTALSERQGSGGANKDLLESTHLMLFGVEKWDDQAQLQTFAKNLSGTSFERVEIFGSTLSDQHQLELANGFNNAFLGNVRKLDLDNTELSDQGAQAIMTRIADPNCSVEELNLQGSVKNTSVLKNILDPLQKNRSLKKIDLKINDIKHQSATAIKDFITKFAYDNTDTFELDLFYNDLQHQGASIIATGLSSGSCLLTHLDLCCNGIGDQGAEAIARALKVNTSLKSLKLALNNIGNKGGVALMSVLRIESGVKRVGVNYSLNLLDLSANVMKETNDNEDDGLSDMLAEVIMHGFGLLDFDFTGIELGDEGWDRIGDALATPKQHFEGMRMKATETIKGNDDPAMHIPVKQERVIRFSIVDLMSKERLDKMEKKIWGSRKDEYAHIDWRRRDPPKNEEEKN